MPFIHPAIFWTGLGAASIPVIIHLINRRRFRNRPWAAMQFLLESIKRMRRRLRIEELILLLLRCLVVAMLGVALGRFTGCSAMNVLPATQAGRTTVFVLDDSYSMGHKLGGTSAFEMATSDLAERLAELPGGETVAVLRSCDRRGEALFKPNFITDLDSLVTNIRTLDPSDSRADLAEVLGRARRIFEQQAGAKRLVVLSDFRKVDLEQDYARDIAQAFDALRGAGVDVVTMDYGRSARLNLSIKSLELLDKFVVAGVPARIAITVVNNGTASSESSEVTLTLRMPGPVADDAQLFVDVELPKEAIEPLGPGDQMRIEMSLTCGEAGPAVVAATLPSDELAGDNSAYLALEVRSLLRVLLIDGRANVADPVDSESFYFAAAVDPSGKAADGVKVSIVSANDIALVEFDKYDLVGLLDVATFPRSIDEEGKVFYPQLTALERYVRAGGGLIIFTGESVNDEFYNGPLLAGGAGLSPYRIGPPRGDQNSWDDYVRLDPASIDQTNPVVATFSGDGRVLTVLVRFFVFTPAEEITVPVADEFLADDEGPAEDAPPAGTPRVLARFTDTDNLPAIVARTFGRGNVVMVYSTASRRWNDWVDDQPRGIYVSPVQDMVRYLARSQRDRQGPRIGQPITVTPPEAFTEAAVTLKLPDFPASDIITLALASQANSDAPAELEYERPGQAGIYTLAMRLPDGSGPDMLLVRNVDPAEGQLDPGGRHTIARAFDSKDFTYVPRASEANKGAFRLASQDEYWLWVMGALLILLAGETFLAQRFGHYSKDVKDLPQGDRR